MSKKKYLSLPQHKPHCVLIVSRDKVSHVEQTSFSLTCMRWTSISQWKATGYLSL